MSLLLILKLSIAIFISPVSGVSAGYRCLSFPPNLEHSIDNDILNVELPRCVSPIENLLNGRFISGVQNYEVTRPPWFNATLAAVGQTFANKYWFGQSLGMILAELIVGAQHDVANTIFSSGIIKNMDDVAKRLASNILQEVVWYKDDLFNSQSDFIESVSGVKSRHFVALHRLLDGNHTKIQYNIDEGIWKAFEKDLEISDAKHRTIPEEGTRMTPYGINQFGMACTLWGFAAAPFIRPEAYGIPIEKVTDEELEGFLHLWAYVANLIGTEDEFNVCLQPNAKEAKIYFNRFLDELMVPYLFNLTDEAKILLEISVKGIGEAIGPIAQFDFLLRRVLEDVVGIPCPNLIKKMTPMGRTIEHFWKTIVLPGAYNNRNRRRLTNFIFDGYVHNLSRKVHGFDGSNITVVAEKGFSN